MTRATRDADRPSRLCLALMRVGTRLAAGFDQEFAAHGLTQAQFRLLIAAATLHDTDRATPSGLADFLLVERATVSVLIKPLLARKLLIRREGADGRSYRVAVSAAGWRALEALKPPAMAAAGHAMAGLTDQDQEELERILTVLEGALRRRAG